LAGRSPARDLAFAQYARNLLEQPDNLRPLPAGNGQVSPS
jgi:hypothetical protein